MKRSSFGYRNILTLSFCFIAMLIVGSARADGMSGMADAAMGAIALLIFTGVTSLITTLIGIIFAIGYFRSQKRWVKICNIIFLTINSLLMTFIGWVFFELWSHINEAVPIFLLQILFYAVAILLTVKKR